MKFRKFLSCLSVCALLLVALPSKPAHAVLLHSGNGQITPPADVLGDPGFANVGKSSTGGASVIYLGNQWCLTANHVTIGTIHGQINFGGNLYTVDDASLTQLHSSDNSLADLKLFRITTNPGLPSLDISTTGPANLDQVRMIGNGFDQGTQRYWMVTGPPMSYTWTEVSSTDPHNASGYDWAGSHIIRWGDNIVDLTNQFTTGIGYGTADYFATTFNDLIYTGAPPPLADEAQATLGDSGGAVFDKFGLQWKLVGMIFSDAVFSNQPAQTAVFGDETWVADLSQYREEILSIVPEPSSFILALAGAAGLYGILRKASLRTRSGR